jgi:hypothetical protein
MTDELDVVTDKDRRVAPIHFRETHRDFAYSHNSGNVAAMVLSGAIAAGLLWIMSEVGFAWFWKGLSVIVLVGCPILTYLSMQENSKLFRYYTWVYRTTKPITGTLQLRAQSSDAGIVHYATIEIPEGKFDCEVIPTNLLPRDAEMKKEVKVYLHPDTGTPLVAEDGDTRVWVET